MDGFRLSPQQRHLWLHQNRQSTPFRAQASILIEGKVDRDVLYAAIQDVVQRHEILHTAFRLLPDANAPLQAISENGLQPFKHHDLCALSPFEQQASLAALFQKKKDRAFDFEQGHIFHLSQVRLTPERHVLLLALPALCADAAGLENLVREISLAYKARLHNETDADEVMQYADIAEWQNELLEGEDGEMGRAFWRRQDFANLHRLQLSFEKQGDADVAFVPEILVHEIPAEVAAKLDFFAEKYKSSRALVLQACYATLLWRMSGERDFVVGVHFNGRKYEELREALGLFAKFLPQNYRLESAMLFTGVLKQVREAGEQIDEWQDFFNWEQLNGAIEQNSAPPYIPYCFEFIPQSKKFHAGEVSFCIRERFVCIDRFKLRLTCSEEADALTTAFFYDAACIQKEDVERFAGAFLALLESCVAQPQAAIADLNALPADEHKRMMVEHNATAVKYPTGKCIHHVIEEQAAQKPDALAIEFENRQLTYGELNARANQVAHRLRKMGVGPGVLVGVCLERSPEMLIGVLGILKAGGAYVPLSPSYPQDRLRFMLEDTQARVLVTKQSTIDKSQIPINKSQVKILCLDAEWDKIAKERRVNPNVAMSPDNLIYVIYTSGSTGKPKGVLITHQGLIISNAARFAYFKQPVHKFLLLSSLSFDSSVVGIFWTLCTGGTLLLVPEENQQNVPELATIIAKHGISHLLTLPSFYALLLEYGSAVHLESLQTAIVAGEACPKKMVERHKEMLPDTALCSEYGATETTVFSSVYDCLEQTINIAPVGGPVENIQMYVLNAHLQPQPVYAAGEMHFGGDALSNGYLNRPDLTAERFIPNPFAKKPGGRLYKSGDLTRHLPNGDIEFLGRIDNQVKIRGFRIELEEIDAVLATHPVVREVCVDARESVPGSKQLVAYIAPESGQQAKIGELRNFLAERLPDYMVPAHFVVLENLPKNPNGKIDRHNLPDPGEERPELEERFVAAQSYVEKKLSQIWAGVLRLDKVGIHDNFFALGGDSILSIQIISKANRAGLHLSPVHIFQHQTVAELAQAVGAESMIHAEQTTVAGLLPLTPIQYWFFEKDLPDPNHWNVSLLLKVHRDVPEAHFKQAARALLAHHDALRIRYSSSDSPLEGGQAGVTGDAASTEIPCAEKNIPLTPFKGGITQTIAGTGEACLFDRVEVSAFHGKAQDAAIEASIVEFQAKLDLAHGPVMRLVLFDRGKNKNPYLLLVLHHLVCDVVSWRVIIEDLQWVLDRLEKGLQIELPAKTTSFKYWAEKLNAYAQSETVAAELNYWKNALSGAQSFSIPCDYSNDLSANTEASTRAVKVFLSEEETRALLQDVPKAFNTQINDVLFTALVQSFGNWTGAPHLLADLEGHGREAIFEEVDLSRTVAWFTSFYPAFLLLEKPHLGHAIPEKSSPVLASNRGSNSDNVRGKISKEMTERRNDLSALSPESNANPVAALTAIKEQLRQIPHRGFNYGLLRYLNRDPQVRATMQNLPQPQVNFNYLGQFDQVLEESPLFSLQQETNINDRSPEGPRSHLLEIVGSVIGGKLQVEWSYSENLHKRETIAKLANDFMEAIRAIIDHGRNADTRDFTESDFAEFDWDQDDLADIAAAIGKSMGEG